MKRYGNNTTDLHHVCFVHLCPGNRRTVATTPGRSTQLKQSLTQHCLISDHTD